MVRLIDKEIRVQYMLPHKLHEELEKLPLIFIPLAPLEWHGLHLAIGTDPINAEHVALEVAKRVGGVVLPTLYMGTERERDPKTLESLGFDKSDYVVGMNFFKAKGLYESFYFSEEIFALVLRAHIELCIDHRYRYIYIISGHGAVNHNNVIERLCIEFNNKDKAKGNKVGTVATKVAFGISFPIPKEKAKIGGIAHAGIEETSLMMYYGDKLGGDKLVDLDQLPSIEEKLDYSTYGIVDGGAFLGNPADAHVIPENLDPRVHSSKDLGKKIFENTIKDLTNDVRKVFDL